MSNKNRRTQAKHKNTKVAPHAETSHMEASKTIDDVLTISRSSLKVLWSNKKLFGGIMLIYGLAYILLARGLTNLPSSSSLSKGAGKLFSGLSTFTLIVGGSASSSTNPTGSTYQAFLIVAVSLVLIWTLRQVYSGNKVRIRDGYYKALYPFIPFVLILIFIGIELLPLIIGSTLYNAVVTQGIAVNAIEKLFAIAVLIGLIWLSLFFLSSSIFALYIVTLTDMTPVKALKSAKALVKDRRALIMRKILFLPLALFIVTSIVALPFILIYPPLAAWIIFLLTLVVIAATHSYLYSLYRELIK
ncbi:MAG TPA: hypothetical protein VIH90_06470 [Candidatus Saccharimonadales bacterium]